MMSVVTQRVLLSCAEIVDREAAAEEAEWVHAGAARPLPDALARRSRAVVTTLFNDYRELVGGWGMGLPRSASSEG